MKSFTNIVNNTFLTSRFFLSSCFFALLLVMWEAAVLIYEVPHYLLPRPTDVVIKLTSELQTYLPHVGITMFEAVTGLFIGSVLGMMLAVLFVKIPFIEKTLHGFLLLSQNIPLVVLSPLLVVWLGFDVLPKVVLVTFLAFFPVVLSTYASLMTIPVDYTRVIHSLGASSWQTDFHVRIPFMIKGAFTGIKIAATYAVMGAVVSEWLGAKYGLGILLTRFSKSFMTDALFAVTFLIILLSVSLVALVSWLEKKIVKW
ncbi:MAG: ABC transporter permease [Bacilli bacterium]